MTPTPFQLLVEGRYHELVARLRDPNARGTFLQEAAAFAGPANGMPVNAADVLAERQLDMRSTGDWSWGLLTEAERKSLFLKEIRLLKGLGVADHGKAQKQAARRLRNELPQLLENVDAQQNDREWLRLMAEHMGDIFDYTNSAQEMLKRYQLLIAMSLSLEDPILAAFSHLGVSRAEGKLGNNTQALVAAQSALATAQQLNDESLLAEALALLASCETKCGELHQAREHGTESLSIFEKLGNLHGQAKALRALAEAEAQIGNMKESQQCHERARELQTRVGNRRGEAYSLLGVAKIDVIKGNFSAAQQHQSACLEILSDLEDVYGQAYTSFSLHYSARRLKQRNNADLHFQRGVELAQYLGNKSLTAWTVSRLGSMALDEGRVAEAGELYEKATSELRECGDAVRLAFCLSCHAVVYFLSSDYKASALKLNEALSMWESMGDKMCMSSLCACVGALLSKVGNSADGSICISNGLHHASTLQYCIEPELMLMIDSAKLDSIYAHTENEVVMELNELVDFAFARLSEQLV